MKNFKQIEHIGIAVKNLETAKDLYESLLGDLSYKEEYVESQNVSTVFFKTGESKIELLASENSKSSIGKFIEKRGEGVHHIAFLVEDLTSEIKRLQDLDFQFVDTIPQIGADNKRIVFLHPKNTTGVLIELCEEIKE